MRRPLVAAIAVTALIALVFALGTWIGGSDDSEAPASGSEPRAESGWLLELEARSGTATEAELRLTESAPSVVAFTDRPGRVARTISTDVLVESWGDLFRDDPPNAVLSWNGHDEARGAVVELDTPRRDGAEIVFGYRVLADGAGRTVALEGGTLASDLDPTMRDVRLFIDSTSLPIAIPGFCDLDPEPDEGFEEYDVNVVLAGGDDSQAVTISWGDGSPDDTIPAGQHTAAHSYSGDGTYTITATGGCEASEDVTFPVPDE